jgi:hypothetical protein
VATNASPIVDPESPLGVKLRSHRVRLRTEGQDTIILQDVPANTRYFNKPGTNLMVKRARATLPFLIAVDDDLAYSGPDAALSKAFAAGTTQQGWRILFLDSRTGRDWPDVVEDALRAVGFDGAEPRWSVHDAAPGASRPGLLETFGSELVGLAPQSTIGRPDAIDEVVCSLCLAHPAMPVVLGESGVGKSHLLRAVAGRPEVGRIVAVSLSRLFNGTTFEAERENLLGSIVEEAAARPSTVLAFEGLELLFSATRLGPGAIAQAIDEGARLVGTALPSLLPRLEHAPLARRLRPLLIFPLSEPETEAAVRAALPALAEHHGVACDGILAGLLVSLSSAGVGHQPAKAIALADAAHVRARMAGAPSVGAVHAYLAAGGLDAD